ncbi:MAG: hypothetical protein HC802_12930 [Caldilineaceae bacterium]|nr:hypothetical protein [Caldilineaceae bacterium]
MSIQQLHPTAHPTAHSTRSYYIFILWGDNFEEATAVTFITELRRAGLLVKVVGLHGQSSGGRYGLVLTADLTLGEAMTLADRAICIVVPCSTATLKRVENDPRVPDFFRLARGNQARFVVRNQEIREESSLKALDFDQESIVYYSHSSDLNELVREIAVAL